MKHKYKIRQKIYVPCDPAVGHYVEGYDYIGLVWLDMQRVFQQYPNIIDNTIFVMALDLFVRWLFLIVGSYI